MGEEAQKRNTDCVYFLASPLTCKKGADCEYRHSEAARVNPRDCWYWLSGNCLNASCSFRHPPLDGRPGTSTANHPSQVAGGAPSATVTVTTSTAASSVPSTSISVSAPPTTSKSTVPCFFFSQGYCAKGVKCPFLHGPPTQYRKEATTYQRPQVTDRPANGEGSAAPNNAKPQSQDRKAAPQVKAPVRAAPHSQEAGYISSHVYKLSASGAPITSGKHLSGNAGEKVDQASQVGRPKLNDMTRGTQSVESRILKGHFSNESSEQFTLSERGSLKAQPLHLDSSRTIKQVRQSAAPHIGRSSDALINSVIQDPFYETEGQHCARELHANDLRNHLKRKKNDGVYSSQLNDFHAKDSSKDRFEGARLASRAVTLTEPKDFAPISNKRAKQEKEISTFSGPKSLAQIKAEKSKSATQSGSKAADSIDDCRNVEPMSGERKDVFDLAAEHHLNLQPEFCKELVDDHSATAIDLKNFEPKNAMCSGDSESGAIQNSRPGVGVGNSNGLSLVSVLSTASEEAEMAANHSSGLTVEPMSKGLHRSRNEIMSGSNECGHVSEGTYPETGYGSADDLMENGSDAPKNVADVDSTLDYDEEDDFTRKLGRYLS